ncbi:hypothetical protein FPV67DRAFT_936616 [Lyophyllum atratum]|nr:hypothetical protein FPV67DRAFT_936616 [Lyophyllum atratum]
MDASRGPQLLHPRPQPSTVCLKCHQPTLGELRECRGSGKEITNWGRWYQRCSHDSCSSFHWHHRATPMDQVPVDIQLAFIVRETAPPISAGGLPCANPTCRTTNNQPRKANRNCSHTFPLCAQCCKANPPKDGCRMHRLATPEVGPVTSGFSDLSIAAGSDLVVPLTTMSQPPHVSQPVSGPRQFARPLREDYGRAYLQHHQKKSATVQRREEALEVANSVKQTVHIVAWIKPGKPLHFKDVTEHPGIYIAAHHKALIQRIEGESFISVCTNYATKEWSIQELTAPITVEPNARILLRNASLEDHDCEHFFEELQLVTGMTAAGAPVPYTTSPTPIPRRQAPPPNPREVDIILDRAISPVPFPLRYVYQMEPGMRKLAPLVGSGPSVMGAKFAELFPKCTFVRTTVYNHIDHYKTAVKMGIINNYMSFRTSREGFWTKLVHEVCAHKEREKKLVKGPNRVSRNLSLNDNDDEVEIIGTSLRLGTSTLQPGSPSRLRSGPSSSPARGEDDLDSFVIRTVRRSLYTISFDVHHRQSGGW